MKKALIFVLLLAAAYVAGYWPQRGLRDRLETARSAVLVCRLQNELINILDQTQSQNYGMAQQIAGQFFDDLHNQMNDSALADYRQSLQTIAGQRDTVISALAKADGSIVGSLRQDLGQVRQIQEKLSAQTNF